jgi:hypothetical protein
MAAPAKKTPTKKTAAQKAPAKKTSAKKTSTKVASKKAAEPQSFRLAPNTENFFAFRPSVQTVYWLVLSGIVLALGVWVILLTARVQSLYDQIDSNLESTTILTPQKSVKH